MPQLIPALNLQSEFNPLQICRSHPGFHVLPNKVFSTRRHRQICTIASSSSSSSEFHSHRGKDSFGFDFSKLNDTKTNKKFSKNAENSVVYKDLKDSLPSLLPPARALTSVGSQSKLSTVDSLCLMNCSSNGTKGRPMSLRILKMKMRPENRTTHNLHKYQQRSSRKYDRDAQSEDRFLYHDSYGNSLSKSFTCLVFMLKVLQRHTLQIRRSLMTEADVFTIQEVANKIHMETQDSFLWLFQQVFVSTPNLMIFTMLLLSDFVVFSMSRHVPLAVSYGPSGYPIGTSPSETAETISTVQDKAGFPVEVSNLTPSLQKQLDKEMDRSSKMNLDRKLAISEIGTSEFSSEISDQSNDHHNSDGNSSMNLQAWFLEYNDGGGGFQDRNGDDTVAIDSFLKHIMESSGLDPNTGNSAIDKATKEMLVAPVSAPKLENDDYACFDRTDLNYQHEISLDPENTLLLSNYAQFMHLVRHDNWRAEQLYKRALRLDHLDGEVLGKFASFLWVAKGDVSAAEAAFQTAMASDPSNSYQAGCYAHFLWNCVGNEQQKEETGIPAYHQSKHV